MISLCLPGILRFYRFYGFSAKISVNKSFQENSPKTESQIQRNIYGLTIFGSTLKVYLRSVFRQRMLKKKQTLDTAQNIILRFSKVRQVRISNLK